MKEELILTIESLRIQNDYDKEWCRKLCELTGSDYIPVYNNGVLVKSIIWNLSLGFNINQEEVRMEIFNFMYELDFGRATDSGLKSAEDLYDYLIQNTQSFKF